jgi:hypothetical protein
VTTPHRGAQLPQVIEDPIPDRVPGPVAQLLANPARVDRGPHSPAARLHLYPRARDELHHHLGELAEAQRLVARVVDPPGVALDLEPEGHCVRRLLDILEGPDAVPARDPDRLPGGCPLEEVHQHVHEAPAVPPGAEHQPQPHAEDVQPVVLAVEVGRELVRAVADAVRIHGPHGRVLVHPLAVELGGPYLRVGAGPDEPLHVHYPGCLQDVQESHDHGFSCVHRGPGGRGLRREVGYPPHRVPPDGVEDVGELRYGPPLHPDAARDVPQPRCVARGAEGDYLVPPVHEGPDEVGAYEPRAPYHHIRHNVPR